MRKKYRGGFTLVELALSMAFVGILSLAVVLIINDTVTAYRRGLTIAQVTTMGSDIVDDMRTAVQNSSSKAVTDYCYTFYGDSAVGRRDCLADEGYEFVAWTRYSKVSMNLDGDNIYETDLGNVPIYGAFCTGTYSYIWNSGYYDVKEADFTEKNNNQWATLTYNDPVYGKVNIDKSGFRVVEDTGEVLQSTNKEKPFRLLKIRDNYRAVCISVLWNEFTERNFYSEYSVGSGFTLPTNFDISSYGSISEAPVDLILEDNDNDLALFDLTVARPAESTTRKNTLYSVSLILGTLTGGVNITSSGQSCQPPENYESGYFDYCAINRFNFVAQAGSGSL